MAAAAIVLVASLAWWFAAERRSPEASSKPAASERPSPCARYGPRSEPVRWSCHDNGAPVDVVTSRSIIVTVLHRPTRVVPVPPAVLGSFEGDVDHDNPPRSVCILEGPSKGLAGFVASSALHDHRCE